MKQTNQFHSLVGNSFFSPKKKQKHMHLSHHSALAKIQDPMSQAVMGWSQAVLLLTECVYMCFVVLFNLPNIPVNRSNCHMWKRLRGISGYSIRPKPERWKAYPDAACVKDSERYWLFGVWCLRLHSGEKSLWNWSVTKVVELLVTLF